MFAPFEGGFHHRPQVGVERLGSGGADETAIAARTREHGKIVADHAAVAQHQNAGAVDIQKRRDLRQHAFGEALHRSEIVQGRGGIDDDFQPAPGLNHG